MKITRYAMMLAAATGLLSACQKLDEVKAYDPDKVVAPVLHALPGEIVITPDNMGSTQTFTWDAADFGVRTQINYSIEASYNDGAKLVLFTGMNGTSSEQTYESLNNILALSVEDGGLGVPSGEPTDVDFYISATIGTDFEKFYSAPATVRMTVTTAERTYPQVWVIGDYCGWNFDNAQGLFCFSGDEVTYEAIVDLGEKAANGFKLSGEAGWNDACNWGTDGDAAAPETEAPSITLISSGGSGNIMVYSKRFYRFVFDRSTLTLSNKLSFNSMGIIGDATPGGWDTDTEMNFDTQKQRFWVDVTLTAGEFKFRADNDWAINFGGADGRLSQNGDNIKATAGNYRVYATLNNSAEITYELNAGDYGTGGGEEPDPGPEKADWYIHGQTVATPDWGPMVTLSPMCRCPAMPTCPANVQLSPTVVEPEMPTCETMKPLRPICTLCPICARLSILVPSPMRVTSSTARSMAALAPTSTALPMATLPTCGIFWIPAGVRAKPKPSAPSTEPGWRMQPSPTCVPAISTAFG